MIKTNQAVGGRGGGGSIGRSLLEADGKKRLPLCSKRTRLLGEGEGGGVALEGVFWRRMVRNVYLYDQNEPGCWGKGRGGVELEGIFWRRMVRNVYLYVQDEPGCWGKGRGGSSLGRSLLEVDGKKRLPLCSKRTRLLGEGEGGGVALEGVFWRRMVRNVYLYDQNEPGCWGKGRGGLALEGVFWRRMVRNVYLYVQDEPGCWGKGRGGSIGRSLLEADGKKRLPLCSRRTRLLGEGEGGGGG